MGALTLKSFPFELRGWDIEKFESFDPTDSFGSNTRVYVIKYQVVQIEPDYDSNNFNTWLTDKGRQFFDGIFNSVKSTTLNYKNKKSFWTSLFYKILESTYIINHCNKLNVIKTYFVIIFDNVSLEVLNLLLILQKSYSFIKLRKVEQNYLNNDLELDFQLNVASNKIKLNSSTFCLLLSINPRYEGYYLNLNLRQRFLKGNFKCLSIGSLVDISFPVTFLGSNIKILQTFSEGNSLACQEFICATNPLIVYSSELSKRSDSNYITQLLKSLKYSGKKKKSWNNLNVLSSSLTEAGNNYLEKIKGITNKDINTANTLYFINVNAESSSFFNKITILNLLTYNLCNSITNKNTLVLDQNYKTHNNKHLLQKIFSDKKEFFNNYNSLPISAFYENEETFINTEGMFKRTTKLLSRKKTRNGWQIIKKLLKYNREYLLSFDNKDNSILFFNSNQIINYKNYTNFQSYASKTLSNLSFFLTTSTSPTFFKYNNAQFKSNSKKINVTKLKYWLDDFFTSGKDEYSKNSLILSNCSKIIRSETTNFF